MSSFWVTHGLFINNKSHNLVKQFFTSVPRKSVNFIILRADSPQSGQNLKALFKSIVEKKSVLIFNY